MEDLTERRTLQDLQLSSLDGSMLLQTRRNTKRKCGVLSDATESTPTELIQQCSLLHSHQPTACRGKENHGNRFVLARRSRQQRELASGLSWDHLPDELLLRILFYLPLQDLLRMCTVCKRLYRLGFDEPLWHSVDLEGLTHAGPALQQVLNTGVCRLRCPHSFIEEPPFTGTEAVKIVHMDLSGSIIPTPVLESILCRCQLLECLSVEGLQLSDHIVHCLSRNPNMLQLNVSGCSGFSAVALGHMLASLSRMEQLNISWCDFSNDHVKSVVSHVSSGVVQLNLSGYRQNLTLEDVKVLVLRCPNIETLDLSDSVLLMADCFTVLAQLKHLLHLSLSRCYHIHAAAFSGFEQTFPTVRLLDVFGLVHDSQLPSLKNEIPRISINSKPFSGVARPTPALCPKHHERTMWGRSCRLRFKM